MGLFSKLRANLERNKGTLAQKLMGDMGMMQKMPEGMRPRRGEGIVQGMFPRLDKTRMRSMPEPRMGRAPEDQEALQPPTITPLLPPGAAVRPDVGIPIDRTPGTGRITVMPEQTRPLLPSRGMPIDPGRMPRFEGGGSADKQYPNKGLAALAKEAPEVVERMGYEMGGEVQNFPRRSAQMMIDELMGAIQNGSPEEMAEKSFLLERLQKEDLSPEQQNMVFAISRMLKERNIPVGGMKVTETSVEMMPGDDIGSMLFDMDKKKA